MICDYRACRICTGCAHGHHDKCRGSVQCPEGGQTNGCECCGRTVQTVGEQ